MPERWWHESPEEIYWVEITDRPDLGADLAAPQLNEDGNSYWSYNLVTEVADGDVVLHYTARPAKQIPSWSRAVGVPYEDVLIWGAHGQASGRGPVEPYERPAWRRPLDGPISLEDPVTYEDLRDAEPAIRSVYEELKATYPEVPLYFPFQLSDGRPVRAFQGYMAKMPRDLILAVPGLAPLVELAERTQPTQASPVPAMRSMLGTDYRRPDEEVSTSPERDPPAVDPNLIDRGLRAHRRTQNQLHDVLASVGRTPRSPAPGEPQFDIAWEDGDTICIAEVKSMSGANEEKQLRLALGQVLRYAHLLSARGRPVRSFIALEREPHDASWIDLASQCGITLMWPQIFEASI
jgi:hypothetical protein